jgi:hypothetical protein
MACLGQFLVQDIGSGGDKLLYRGFCLKPNPRDVASLLNLYFVI